MIRSYNSIDRPKDLTLAQTREAVEEIMRGEVNPARMATFLIALRIKGESVEEITGAALAMRGVC